MRNPHKITGPTNTASNFIQFYVFLVFLSSVCVHYMVCQSEKLSNHIGDVALKKDTKHWHNKQTKKHSQEIKDIQL